jgi:hypothetical protein
VALRGCAAGPGLAKGVAGAAGDESHGARPDPAVANGPPGMNARARRRAARAAKFGPTFSAAPQGAAGTSTAAEMQMAAPVRAPQGCPLAAAPQGASLPPAARAPKGVTQRWGMADPARPAGSAREGGGLAVEACVCGGVRLVASVGGGVQFLRGGRRGRALAQFLGLVKRRSRERSHGEAARLRQVARWSREVLG